MCLFVYLSTPESQACSSGTGILHILFPAISIVPRQCLASRCLTTVCVCVYACMCTYTYTCMCSISELELRAKYRARCWRCAGRADSVPMLGGLTVDRRWTGTGKCSRMGREAWGQVQSVLPVLRRAAPVWSSSPPLAHQLWPGAWPCPQALAGGTGAGA